MNIFISYPSERRAQADALRLALEAEGHEVFFDRTDLPAGEAFHKRLRDAVAAADLMVFLVCPESVDSGGYALTELGYARTRWPHPAGRVLPVMVAPVPPGSLPPYLQAVTLLQPQGDLVAETVAAVHALDQRGSHRRRLSRPLLAAILALALAGAVALGWQARERDRLAAEAARQRDALTREVQAAARLCETDSHALAWTSFDALVAGHPQDEGVRTAREDCAMRWLRNMRAVADKQTFTEQVDRVQPVLARALATAQGPRAGDLHAHIGWGEHLRGRDGGAAPDPVAHYRRAVAADPDNPYAHAMWAHRVAWVRGPDAEMRRHFDAALRSTRGRSFARALQFSVAFNRFALTPYAVGAADAMRLAGESPTPEQRERLWRLWCEQGLQIAENRQDMFADLAAPAALATYRWLHPLDKVADWRRPVWRLCEGIVQAQAGDRAGARASLQAVLDELGAERAQDRAAREARGVIQALGG